MGMALRSIADDHHLFVFNQVNVSIAVVIYAHGLVPSWLIEVPIKGELISAIKG